MGRHRVEIKKIENKAIRQVTFAKRRNGLLKKAYEISALCDIEVALLAFSPSGKPTIFGGKKRFDQILAHYINLTEHQEGGVEDVESLQRLIEGMRRERNMYNHRKIGGEMYVDAQMEEIQRDMNLVGNQFDEVTTQLKYYEEIPSYIRTVSEIEAFEEFLRQTMSQIQMQKQLLLEAHHRAPQLGQNYLMTAPLLEKLDVEIPAADQVLTGGGHSNTLHVSATTMRGNSIYNTNSNNSTLHVPQTSMLNFVDSNGSSATGNLEGQYVKNNNMVSQAPFVEERNVGTLMTRVEEGKDEVRNYYIELARRLGLSTTLPGFTFDHNTPTGSGAQQNPSGHGGPAGGGGGSAGPSGQASFQATRDPRRG